MWIVRLALRRPLSVAVMALLMLVLGALSFELMNVDIFPAINLPVVLVVWNYPGLSAFDVERRMVFISERAYSTTVNGIEHIESESINGLGILKVYFQPGSDLGAAIAQMDAVSETILTILPRGTEPPQIISYNASNVPVAQLNIYSDTLSTGRLFDYGLNFIRIQLFTIPGFSSPAPLGGVQRAVMVNLDPTALYANGMSASDLGNALASTNVVIPSGTEKIGNYEYNVDLNMSVPKVKDFNRLPVKYVNGSPVFLGDIAPVTDTHQPQTNVVRVDGQQATYLMVIKHADASTLTVVDAVKAKIPLIRATAPKGLKVSLSFDQSQFVRAALWDVVQEAVIAAALVALMVLLFLGSPRSMLIVITSIPLSILTAIVALKLSRPDDQHDDARRNRAGGRDAGRRRDGGNRKYPSQPRDAQAVAGRDSRRRLADRDADLRRHAFDLHRVFSGRAADRRREVPVHAARAGGGIRDADVVSAVAHAGAHDGALPAARRSRGPSRAWPLGQGGARVRSLGSSA